MNLRFQHAFRRYRSLLDRMDSILLISSSNPRQASDRLKDKCSVQLNSMTTSLLTFQTIKQEMPFLKISATVQATPNLIAETDQTPVILVVWWNKIFLQEGRSKEFTSRNCGPLKRQSGSKWYNLWTTRWRRGWINKRPRNWCRPSCNFQSRTGRNSITTLNLMIWHKSRQPLWLIANKRWISPFSMVNIFLSRRKSGETRSGKSIAKN